MVFKDKEEDNLEDFKKGFVCYIFKDYIWITMTELKTIYKQETIRRCLEESYFVKSKRGAFFRSDF